VDIGIILPNWIGDVAMATPTLRAIHRKFGEQGRIVGVMKPYVKEVLDGSPWLDDIVLYNRRAGDPGISFLTAARKLRTMKLDALAILPNSLSSGCLGYLSGAKRRVGYARNCRSTMLTDRLTAARSGGQWTPISAVDYFLPIAYQLGCPTEERRMELRTTPEEEAIADDTFAALEITPDENVVAFNTGGAFGGAKHWPVEHYVDLAKRVVREPNTTVLVNCGPNERDAANEIAISANHPRVKSLASMVPSIGPSKAILARCQLVVSTDSGPRHLAVALGVPTVALFGPIDKKWSTTYGPRETVLDIEVDCGPCGQRVCPKKHHRCMRDLSVDMVFAAVRRQLSVDNISAA